MARASRPWASWITCFPDVKGVTTSTCRLSTQPNHSMSCLEEIYKSWIRLWSVIDSFCNVSSVKPKMIFFFIWEICSGSFIYPDPVTLLGNCWGCCAVNESRETSCCLMLVFTFCPAWPSYYGFINQHRIERSILDPLLKALHVDFFCFLADTSLMFTAAASQILV